MNVWYNTPQLIVVYSPVSQSPLRYKRLIKELPNHKHAKDALIAAGFSEKTADKQSKRTLDSAIRHTAKDLIDGHATGQMSSKQLMSELVGLSSADLMNRLRFIATQDKDLSSALKVLLPLVKQHGVVLDSGETQAIVPVLSIVVEKTPLLEGSTEPVVDAETV